MDSAGSSPTALTADRLRSLVDADVVGIACGRAELITDANQAFMDLFGLTVSDLDDPGAGWDEVFDTGLGQQVLPPTELSAGSLPSFEQEYRRPDGRRMMVHMAMAVTDPDGPEWIGVFHELGGLRLDAHPALNGIDVIDHLGRAFVDTTPALFMVVDPDGRIRFLNRAAIELLGPHALVGRRYDDVGLADDEVAELDKLVADPSLKTTTAFEVNWPGPAPQRWFDWHNTAVLDADGCLVSVVAAGADVTERRQLELHLARSQRMQAVGQLAGEIAHDFNNTMAVVRLQIEQVARGDLTDDQVSRLGAAMATIDEGSRLVNDLMAYSRAEPTHFSVFDLRSVVSDRATALADVMGAHISLEVDLDPDEVLVRADQHRLGQVLTNLVLNARSAITDHGVITISVRTGPRPSHGPGPAEVGGVLSVTDDGAGMAPATLSRAREPFFTTKAPGEGSGLGLATAHRTVTSVGGTLDIDSRLGEGTTVTVWLPPVSESAGQPGDPLLPTAARAANILVVEDQPTLRNLMCDLLAVDGHGVTAAESASHGLQLIEELGPSFDLMVTDVVMPEHNGPELARALKGLGTSAKVVYVTGHDRHNLDGCLDADDRVVYKPFTAEALRGAVSGALGIDA